MQADILTEACSTRWRGGTQHAFHPPLVLCEGGARRKWGWAGGTGTAQTLHWCTAWLTAQRLSSARVPSSLGWDSEGVRAATLTLPRQKPQPSSSPLPSARTLVPRLAGLLGSTRGRRRRTPRCCCASLHFLISHQGKRCSLTSENCHNRLKHADFEWWWPA